MCRCKIFDSTLKMLREKLFSLDYISDLFLFGSVAKGKVHENSDLDLLVIGTKPKTIEVLMELDKLCENDVVDVDVKYYFIDDFIECLNGGSLFLKELSTYAIDLKEMIL